MTNSLRIWSTPQILVLRSTASAESGTHTTITEATATTYSSPSGGR